MEESQCVWQRAVAKLGGPLPATRTANPSPPPSLAGPIECIEFQRVSY